MLTAWLQILFAVHFRYELRPGLIILQYLWVCNHLENPKKYLYIFDPIFAIVVDYIEMWYRLNRLDTYQIC